MIVAGIVSLLVAAEPSVWEVRRAHAADQRPEWTAKGYLPAWTVTVGDGPWPTIDIGDNAAGDCRGWALAGRRWTVPSPLPASLRVRLKFQTCCALDGARPRAGQPSLALFTPAGWQRLATDPRRAAALDLEASDAGGVGAFRIHGAGDDVTQWRDWESPELRSTLSAYAGQDLVLAVVWGCFHQGVVEWGKFSGIEVVHRSHDDLDRELLEALDASRPELEAVAGALRRNDLAAAKAALVAHVRTRARPVGPPLSRSADKGVVAEADLVCRHVFRLASCPPTQLPVRLRWNEDPHDYDQWPIALNRHAFWNTLGRAYAATGDEKYAREFVQQLESWIEAMPVRIGPSFLEGPYLDPRRSPLSLDAGIRMATSWWQAYGYFKDSASFGVASQFRMLRSLRDHALYLMDRRAFHPQSNWGAMEIAGLMQLAVMLPEFRDAPQWLETALARLVEAQQAQVYPDGAQTELATGYHYVTLDNFLHVLDIAGRNAVPLPAEFQGSLERMFQYFVGLAMPDGRVPSLNDGSWLAVERPLARGAELFPHRADFAWFASRGRRGSPPAAGSVAFPYAGWYVMRTGWQADDLYLLFEAGPYGAAHQHEDQLNLILHAGRRTVLTEAGNYSYDRSGWRRYVLSTRAHNTILVDGLEQNRRTRRETWVDWNPPRRRWHSDADFDVAEGAYTSGYGPQNDVSVTHARLVVFLKPDYWLVVDRLTPADTRPHRYEALFHLDAADAVVDEPTRAVSVAYEGHEFRIVPHADRPLEVEIVRGRTEPSIQGWLPTGRHNDLRPVPTAVYRWSAAGPTTAVFALVPRRAGKPWPVTGLGASPTGQPGWTLRRADGGEDRLRLAPPSGVSLDRSASPGTQPRRLDLP